MRKTTIFPVLLIVAGLSLILSSCSLVNGWLEILNPDLKSPKLSV